MKELKVDLLMYMPQDDRREEELLKVFESKLEAFCKETGCSYEIYDTEVREA